MNIGSGISIGGGITIANDILGIVTTNLVLYYDPSQSASYPGTGTTVYDLSTSGLNGTMSNITYTNPYFGFNGSTSQISRADDPLIEPGSGNWTMEAWVNGSSFSTSAHVILGKFNNGGASSAVSYSMRVGSNASAYAQYGDGTGTYFNSTAYTLSLNTWYQIVYVFSNGGTKNIQTYINGATIGTVTHTLASLLNASNPLYIGSYNGGEYNQYWTGSIGAVRLYKAALTSGQVAQNFNATRAVYGI